MKTIVNLIIDEEGNDEGFVVRPSRKDFEECLFVVIRSGNNIQLTENVDVEVLEDEVDLSYISGVKKLIKAGSAVLWVDSGLIGE